MSRNALFVISCVLLVAGQCQSPRPHNSGPPPQQADGRSADLSAGQADSVQRAGRSATEAEIIGLLRSYDEAWNQKDTTRVGEMLAREYVYFGSRGNVVSREGILEFLRSPSYVLDAATRSELEVHLYGATAAVSSRWRGRGRYHGDAFQDDQRCSVVLVKEGGTWKIALEHCTAIFNK